MISIKVAAGIGVALLSLGVLGAFVSGRLFGIITADSSINVLRLFAGTSLLLASLVFKTKEIASFLLITIGILLVGAGLLSILDSFMIGLAPIGFTMFDTVSSIIVGLISIVAGVMPHKNKDETFTDSV